MPDHPINLDPFALLQSAHTEASPSARWITDGTPTSPLWIVGEAPGANEITDGKPFVGASGLELDRMLIEAGFNRSQFYLTNVCHSRPPDNEIENYFSSSKRQAGIDGTVLLEGRYPHRPVLEGMAHLHAEIEEHKPRLILALGNTALWALTGLSGIGKWRGSHLPASLAPHPTKVIPTWHPAAILREWSLRHIAVQDLRRAKRESYFPEIRRPTWDFLVAPTAPEVISFLTEELGEAEVAMGDIETREGQIECLSFATSTTRAICIPFMSRERPAGYYTPTEELGITLALQGALRRPDLKLVWQNGAYDLQYFAKQWGFLPNCTDDPMLMQHVCFPGLRKGLDFLSSLYCQYHRYWKDDGKEANLKMDDTQRWLYNCEDTVRTFECWHVLDRTIDQLKLRPQYTFQMHRLFPEVIKMMLRGIKTNSDTRKRIGEQFAAYSEKATAWVTKVLGHPLNPESNKACHALFYQDFNIQAITNRKTGRPTLDDEALTLIARRNPLLYPLISTIQTIRSVNTLRSTVLDAKIDPSGRARCSINLAVATTYRFSSSEDAFGYGFNMQTMTKGEDEVAVDEAKWRGPQIFIPNFRDMFEPDPGYTMFEADYSGADARVVAWESDDRPLKQVFAEGKPIHAHNAQQLWPEKLAGVPLAEIRGDKKWAKEYHHAKTATHAVDYVCKAPTLASHLNISRAEAQAFIDAWFGLHPGILGWHNRTNRQLWDTRTVSNKFGYRRYFFDRVQSILPEAVAWIGQSTTAIAINHALVCMAQELESEGLEVLLQVHDSILGQFPTPKAEWMLPRIKEAMHVPIPYPDPLIIPAALHTSTESWGQMKEVQV